ncbi:DUF3800 domain-containing protein [Dietzia sp. WMMA184]|nr:DUF3800 domain-containing protein [Dietzia sp. WMMA184]
MIFAYIDDTGDDGDPAKNGATKCFGLGCLGPFPLWWTPGDER